MPRIVPLVLVAAVLLAPAAESQQRQQHGRLFPPENLGLLEVGSRRVAASDQIMDVLGIAEAASSLILARRAAGSRSAGAAVGPNGRVAEDIQPRRSR